MSHEPAANRHRTALHNENIPDGPLTNRQRAIADAVRLCHNLADFTAAPQIRVTSVVVAAIRWGSPDELAVEMVRRGIAQARSDIDTYEALLNAYGARAFAPQAEPVDCVQGATRHDVVTRLLRTLSDTGRVLVRAGDRCVAKDRDGSYVVQPAA